MKDTSIASVNKSAKDTPGRMVFDFKNQLIHKYKDIRFKYLVDLPSKNISHYISVDPASFLKNKEFESDKKKFKQDFIRKFPNNNIFFIPTYEKHNYEVLIIYTYKGSQIHELKNI